MPTQHEIQQEITARIIEGLQAGTVPWRKPWLNDANCGVPTNVVSKRAYSGVNPLLLDIVAMSRGYTSRWWGTFEQWKGMGACVKKRPTDVEPGKWGTSIIFWKQVEKKTKDKEEEKIESFPMLRYYTVFNIDQVEGEKVDHLRASATSNDSPIEADYEAAQQAINATNADIRIGGNKAFYKRPIGPFPNHTDGDYIQMPKQEQFWATHEYYATQLHELMHWSEVRVGWNGSYEMGELIAEIGSAFLSAQLNIPCSDDLSNHTAYLASWLKELKEDDRAIMRAASQASKAANFVLSFSRKTEDELVAA